MCGIFCILSPSCENNQDLHKTIYKQCRTSLNRRGPDSISDVNINVNNWDLLLSCSVLWLQGELLTKQPIETEKFWFLYNGDIFGNEVLPDDLRAVEGDTKPLLNSIENFNIIETLSKVNGPFAFILIDKINNKLYFGRDTYGRRSLLIGLDKNKLLLTSVATRNVKISMIELPALGIYSLDLNINNINSLFLYPWKISNQIFSVKLKELEQFLSITIETNNINDFTNNITNIICPVEYISIFEKITNVSTNEAFKYLESNNIWFKNVKKLKSLLENALERRIKNQPKFCSNCIKEKIICNHATIGILFSGGLDCAILSLLADKFVESHRQIDLMNVAFEKGNNYNTPDRQTAQETLKELQQLRPDRNWNLLEINVTQDELNKERKNRIADLIYPLESILDDSLGCALWFAAKGKTEDYVSPVRVLLVGMGADELFGGYTRHRAAYKRGEWTTLTQELDNDWRNISHRNLARDDRVISDHGRQVRTPYLDENVVEFVRKLNAWERCYPSERVVQGLGDKLLLRSLAHHLGFKQAAVLRKRALQFGSRIANSKENAHEKSPRLLL